MNVSIIEQRPLRLITVKATSCPEGIPEAWQTLEKLRSIKGRKSYGVITSGEPTEYYAGLVSDGEIEERATGMPVVEVPGGPCARAILMDWRNHIPEIGPLFGQLASQYPMDTSRPSLEFYRSQSELHILVPILQ